jgi:ABC-type multidrug transport system ATPase subunit
VLGSNYPNLTAFENLRLAAGLYQHDVTRAELEAKLEAVGLQKARNKLVREFSSGMKKRLAIARLVLSDADLWLLDEPYAVLDDEGKELIDNLLKLARQDGRTVLMASHELYRSATFADSVLELEQGQLRQLPWQAEAAYG